LQPIGISKDDMESLDADLQTKLRVSKEESEDETEISSHTDPSTPQSLSLLPIKTSVIHDLVESIIRSKTFGDILETFIAREAAGTTDSGSKNITPGKATLPANSSSSSSPAGDKKGKRRLALGGGAPPPDGNDSDSSEDDRDHKKPKKMPKPQYRRTRLLVCPYLKFNIERFEMDSTCNGRGFSDIPPLK
jgi:hypothetical protein